MTKYAIIHGNVISGFSVIGPFDTEAAAEAYDQSADFAPWDEGDEHTVIELAEPEIFEDDDEGEPA